MNCPTVCQWASGDKCQCACHGRHHGSMKKALHWHFERKIVYYNKRKEDKKFKFVSREILYIFTRMPKSEREAFLQEVRNSIQ